MLTEELDKKINKEYFWIDSKKPLCYISNSSKRFKIFIANKIQFICDRSDIAQGHYNYIQFSRQQLKRSWCYQIKQITEMVQRTKFPQSIWRSLTKADFSRSKWRWSGSKTSCFSECNYHQTGSNFTTEKKNVKLGKNEEVAAHILKLKTQLSQKIKQRRAILTSNRESTGTLLIDVELL